jgi:uncharacterized membrane protein YqjE
MNVMEEDPSSTPALGESFRVLKDAFGRMAQDRVALAKVELQLEKYRLIQIFIWISAAIVTGMLALTFGSLTLLYVFRHSAPVMVLSCLALAYALAVVFIILGFKRLVAKNPVSIPDDKDDDPADGPPGVAS